MLPDAKILAVLRDPVLRTYSHWKERRRNHAEPLAFSAALDAEDARLGGDEARLKTDPSFYSYAHEQQSYARQSEYATALERWYAVYPAEQILVFASEDYYERPQATLDRVLDFLGVPREPIASGQVRNAAAGSDMDPTVRTRLRERFAPYNAELRALTGQPFPWS
jgi:hypothetical protein